MAISPKVKEFLDGQGVSYEVGEHSLAYTASEVASSQHVPGKQMVKSVIVKNNGDYYMVVLPSIHLVDFEKLKSVVGSDDLRLADEEEVGQLFPDYDLGAEPPFGQLYGLKVIVEKLLDDGGDIVFNAGTHTDVVKLNFADYKKIVDPIVAEVGTHI